MIQIIKGTEGVHSEIGQTSRTEIFPKQSTTEIRKPFRKKTPPQSFSRFLNMSLDS